MNERDRANLSFLMKCPQHQFDEWMEKASADDVDYAIELIRKAKIEMLDKQVELEHQLDVDDFTEARAVIERIKNAGKI